MGLSTKKLAEIKIDYYSGPLNETLDIKADDPFWDWFRNNANIYCFCEGIDIMFDGNYPAGNCFGNSIKISHQNGCDYCEGFAKVKGLHILHGFNSFGNCVIDATALSNKHSYQNSDGILPIEYYGIRIPEEYLPSKPIDQNAIEYTNQTSLILNYYRQTNTKT